MAVGVGASGWVGIGREAAATPGTYVPPEVWLPLRSESLQYIQDTIWRRVLAGTADIRGPVPGNLRIEGDMDCEILESVLPYLLAAARGNITKTGAGPYTYTFNPTQVAIPDRTLSITVLRNNQLFAYVGCVIGSMSYTVEDMLLVGTFSVLGRDEVGGYDSVRAVATSNVVALSGAQTIDGVSVVAGDRVLLTAQTAPEDNGIYVVATGAWARATDLDAASEFVVGKLVYVREGTTGTGARYELTVAPATLGTDPVTFAVSGTAFSFPPEAPFGAGQYSIQIPTATQVFDTDTFSFEVEDNAEAQYRLKNTGRGMQFAKYGEREMTVSMERDFDSRKEYDDYKALTAKGIRIVASKGANASVMFDATIGIADSFEITGLTGQAELIRASVTYRGILDPAATPPRAYQIVVVSAVDIT